MKYALIDAQARVTAVERSMKECMGLAIQDCDELDHLMPLHLYILEVLYTENNQHVSAIARKVGKEPTSFTPVLDKLEKLHLIRRSPDKEDRRAIFVGLTARGLAIQEVVQSILEATEESFR